MDLSPDAVAIIGFLVLFGLMLLRVPVGMAMGLVGVSGYAYIAGPGPALKLIGQSSMRTVTDYTFGVIPMFMLMGAFVSVSGVSKELFRAANAFIGHLRGGLGVATVLACGGFAAICGSSVATAATITGVALPEMKRHGYSGRLSTGTLAAGGTLGILIPPSVPLVIYAILTEQNIAKLFAAAMVPGIVAMLGYMIAIAIYVRVVPGHAPEVDDDVSHLTWGSIKGVAPIMAIFVIVFGGIYSGMFTPTEGAAVGAASTFIASLFKGEITWEKFKQCFYATADSSAMIFLIFIGADLMNGALALSQASTQLSALVMGLGWSPIMVVVGILLFYVVLGAVMDELSMILLTIPIFFPIVIGMDFGMPKESVAIWFGILVLMVVEFGLLAPPVGLNVYVVNGMAKDIPIAESYRGVMPFLISDTLRTLLILFFPGICLWLVSVIT